MKEMILSNFLKRHMGMVLLSVLLLSLGIYHKDLFFMIALVYIYIIRIFASDFFGEKIKKDVAKIIWIAAAILAMCIYYVNHYLPHGEMYSTGEIVCQNDDRGPCGEKYKEYLSGLNNPMWAIFLKEYGMGFLVALVVAAFVLIDRKSSDV